MSIKKSIGWTDKTINPIKGMCKGGCWYCYYSGKRGMLNRFKQDPEIRLDFSVFVKLPKSPKKIFLCSTHDLFGDWIPKSWRDIIFFYIEGYPQHTFQILTKFPQNIDREMPPNVWLGCTVEHRDFWERAIYHLGKIKAKIKFISFEPLFSSMNFSIPPSIIDWVIVGQLTQHGKKYKPEKAWIQEIVDECKFIRIPIFLKDNLRGLYEPLIQEMPK